MRVFHISLQLYSLPRGKGVRPASPASWGLPETLLGGAGLCPAADCLARRRMCVLQLWAVALGWLAALFAFSGSAGFCSQPAPLILSVCASSMLSSFIPRTHFKTHVLMKADPSVTLRRPIIVMSGTSGPHCPPLMGPRRLPSCWHRTAPVCLHPKCLSQAAGCRCRF